MTINNVSVNVNAAASALTKYLNEVEKIAEKVSLSVEDVDMIIRLNRKNLRFQEVIQLGNVVESVAEKTAEVKEENKPVVISNKKGFKPINMACSQEIKNNTLNLAQFIFKDIIQKIDTRKIVCIDNVYTGKEDVFEYAMNLLKENGVKEVHFRFANKASEEIREIASKFSDNTMKIVEAEKSAREPKDTSNEVPMPEEPKKGRYMSSANMASLDASAPARVNKNSIMAAAKRLAAAKAKPAQAPAAVSTPAPAVVSEPVVAPTPVKEDTQKQMSVEDYANEILAEAGLDEWDVADITDSFKELCGSKAPEPEQVVETATVIAPAADDVAENTFVVPSFEEMMGFGSVSTYVEKDGEVVVDDGKDTEDELTEEKRDELLAGVSLNGYTEETPYTIDDIPNMDARRFEREYEKMLKCIEKGKAPTPYQEALLKEAEENRDAGFMRLEDTTLMVSARVR